LIDGIAIYAAWSAGYSASGRHLVGFLAACGVGAYGLWCWFDGKES
jgi:hypothetical protein